LVESAIGLLPEWTDKGAPVDLESLVTLILERKGNQTLVALRHANLPDDELGRRHEGGWGFILGVIAKRTAESS
jgi:hypothetical protein